MRERMRVRVLVMLAICKVWLSGRVVKRSPPKIDYFLKVGVLKCPFLKIYFSRSLDANE